MTRRLYYDDAYRLEFRSEVTAVERDPEGHALVRLRESCFYPESGGQMSDRGTLGGFEVLEVFESEGEVVHRLSTGAMVSVGEFLDGLVDETRRAHHRQQHTGQHVLSRIIEDRLGLPTLSSRLGESGNTLDLELDELPDELLDEFEEAAMRIVQEARPVHLRVLDPEQADVVDRGKIPAGQAQLRVIEIEGFDRNACGGTHCAHTAEIGAVAITRTERVRGGLRLHFLCGARAREHRRRRDRLVARLGRLLTTGDAELESAVARLLEEGRHHSRRSKDLARRLAGELATAWARRPERGQVEGRALPVVCRILEEELHEGLQEAVARVLDEPVLTVALMAPREGRVQTVLARGPEAPPVDCGALLREALAPLGGKGGGKPDRAQGGYQGSAEEGLRSLRSVLGLD